MTPQERAQRYELEHFDRRIEGVLAEVLRKAGAPQPEETARACREEIMPYVDGFIDFRAGHLPARYLRRQRDDD